MGSKQENSNGVKIPEEVRERQYVKERVGTGGRMHSGISGIFLFLVPLPCLLPKQL